MKKLLVSALCIIMMPSCQQSLEDRAAAEAEEYTRRECPCAIADNIVQDSMAYDKDTKTLVYYYTLQGPLDNKAELEKYSDEYEMHFRQGITTMPALRKYADHGFAFRYVYRSQKTGGILLDLDIRPSKQNK